MANKMSDGVKGVLLVAGAYIITIGVAALIIALTIMSLLEESRCSVMTRAMLILWVIIAVVFIASVVVVRILAWKVVQNVGGRWAILIAHGVALLASYVVIAFGLLVAFNC